MRRLLQAILLSLVLFPQVSLAIPPPEIIINIGAQVAAVASVVMMFLSAAFTTFYQHIKVKLSKISRRHWLWGAGISIFSLTIVASIAAHSYFQNKAQTEYSNWLAESQSERTEILAEEWFIQEETEEESEEEIIEEETVVLEGEDLIEEEPSFYEVHIGEGDIISNEDLAAAISGNEDNYILLDARENLEIEAGRIPGAVNIRFADLLNGDWDQLDKDKYIYVICASAMRGVEVSGFLREKGLVAKHLEEGAQSWVEWGGEFEGTIVFSEYYTNWYYHTYLTSAEVHLKESLGAILIDAREPSVFEDSGILGSLYIALLYTPSEDLEAAFAQVPAGSTVITVCSDWINCFDAKMVGIELERRGHNFIGRYNTPDEY